jgi:DNA-binding LytR/AlgR family response regulator
MALNYLIIEDEKLSAERLEGMISRLFPDFVHKKTLDSVKSAVRWLSQNEQPHLAFFDIQLADGLSFEIFEQAPVQFPIIFTTAFDEYAIRAFRVNSIDYLLKPVSEEDLIRAVNKFQSGNHTAKTENDALAMALMQLTNTYKSRFLVKIGEHLKMIDISEVALFMSSDKSTFIRSFAGRDYGLSFTLEQLESLVDPGCFFRVNRKYLIHIKAISDIIAYSNSRLKIKLSVPCDEDVIVSRERVEDFKKWLEGGR